MAVPWTAQLAIVVIYLCTTSYKQSENVAYKSYLPASLCSAARQGCRSGQHLASPAVYTAYRKPVCGESIIPYFMQDLISDHHGTRSG